MIKTGAVSIFIILTMISCVTPQKKESRYRYVNAQSGLNLRKMPSLLSSIITTVPFNSKVKIMNDSKEKVYINSKYGKWLKVQYQKGYKIFTGWMFDAYLSFKKVPVIEGIFTNSFTSQLYIILRKDYTYSAAYNNCQKIDTITGKYDYKKNIIFLYKDNYQKWATIKMLSKKKLLMVKGTDFLMCSFGMKQNDLYFIKK